MTDRLSMGAVAARMVTDLRVNRTENDVVRPGVGGATEVVQTRWNRKEAKRAVDRMDDWSDFTEHHRAVLVALSMFSDPSASATPLGLTERAAEYLNARAKLLGLPQDLFVASPKPSGSQG